MRRSPDYSPTLKDKTVAAKRSTSLENEAVTGPAPAPNVPLNSPARSWSWPRSSAKHRPPASRQQQLPLPVRQLPSWCPPAPRTGALALGLGLILLLPRRRTCWRRRRPGRKPGRPRGTRRRSRGRKLHNNGTAACSRCRSGGEGEPSQAVVCECVPWLGKLKTYSVGASIGKARPTTGTVLPSV